MSCLDFKNVKRYSLSDRKSKVCLPEHGHVYEKGLDFKGFLGLLPEILAGSDFRKVVEAIVRARKNGRAVILGMGAHPVKVGLSPLIIDLMKRGIITALAANGATIIHDFELAYTGHTSEDVQEELQKGTFGMAEETGVFINRAITDGVKKGYGIGRSLGEFIHNSNDCNNKEISLFAAGAALGIPATVHVAIGTDIVHMHPEADGGAIGEGSLRDFRLFASKVAELEGGVYINLGSAVIMPEVFLKALTLARNTGQRVFNFTTLNMDFIRHYRAFENVTKRPVIPEGIGITLVGHHEIMFPLLIAAIIESM